MQGYCREKRMLYGGVSCEGDQAGRYVMAARISLIATNAKQTELSATP